MDCLSTFSSEHWLIQRFASHLPSVLAESEIVGPWRPELELAAEFLGEFVASYHDAREERVLFPFLLERGFDHDSGGRSLVHEHGSLARRRRILGDLLQSPAPDALEEALHTLRAISTFLQEHLARERHLHAVLQRLLSEEDERELASRLHASFPNAQKKVERAHSLLRRLGVPPRDSTALPA